jgi:hypothetical protein
MRSVKVLFFAAILVVTSVNAWAKNPLGPKYTIHVAAGISINGDLADWKGAEWVTYDANSVVDTGGRNWNDPDAVCTFAMMYDAQALYCAAQVTDDFISYFPETTNEYAWWERDGVQWFIDFTNNEEQEILLWPDYYNRVENVEAGEKWLPGEMIIAIGATEDQTDVTTRRWPVGTRDGDRSDWNDFTLPDGTVVRSEVNEQWESVVKITGTGYIIEVKVPWASLEKSKYFSDPEGVDPANPDDIGDLAYEDLDNLGWKPLLPSPLAGSTIGFTHLCIDCDLEQGGFDAQAMWVGDGDNDANWTEAVFAVPTATENWALY